MKITKHCASSHPSLVNGQILGLEVDNVLHVTHSFPFPTTEPSSDHHYDSEKNANSAAAGVPRSRQALHYQAEMVKCLREINVDANVVGWYQSANLGNFISKDFVENQYAYQSSTQYNERTVVLVHDAARSAQGALALRAFRLTKEFMNAMKEGKFTTER